MTWLTDIIRGLRELGGAINQMDLYALAIDNLSEEELKSLRSEGDVLTALAAKGRELLFAHNSSEK